ncbi:hypothetical protein EK21DRAFT_111756 [Setomelanomma holmii]|uniref:Uncharacterized protein n=1 Tax=Setomelanomma holmii TaxID=210430 RepID=A0A9P4HBR0_9PLEO|nr:hypothetical protein EK21DRAFT_111756 [Setomelanomma holmii]
MLLVALCNARALAYPASDSAGPPSSGRFSERLTHRTGNTRDDARNIQELLIPIGKSEERLSAVPHFAAQSQVSAGVVEDHLDTTTGVDKDFGNSDLGEVVLKDLFYKPPATTAFPAELAQHTPDEDDDAKEKELKPRADSYDTTLDNLLFSIDEFLARLQLAHLARQDTIDNLLSLVLGAVGDDEDDSLHDGSDLKALLDVVKEEKAQLMKVRYISREGIAG